MDIARFEDGSGIGLSCPEKICDSALSGAGAIRRRGGMRNLQS
jgi:hypothetical protein